MTKVKVKVRTPWVVVHDSSGRKKPPYTMECQRCNETFSMPIPVSVDMFVAVANAFGKQHRLCRG